MNMFGQLMVSVKFALDDVFMLNDPFDGNYVQGGFMSMEESVLWKCEQQNFMEYDVQPNMYDGNESL